MMESGHWCAGGQRGLGAPDKVVEGGCGCRQEPRLDLLDGLVAKREYDHEVAIADASQILDGTRSNHNAIFAQLHNAEFGSHYYDRSRGWLNFGVSVARFSAFEGNKRGKLKIDQQPEQDCEDDAVNPAHMQNSHLGDKGA
jgi:hypothetical protein